MRAEPQEKARVGSATVTSLLKDGDGERGAGEEGTEGRGAKELLNFFFFWAPFEWNFPCTGETKGRGNRSIRFVSYGGCYAATQLRRQEAPRATPALSNKTLRSVDGGGARSSVHSIRNQRVTDSFPGNGSLSLYHRSAPLPLRSPRLAPGLRVRTKRCQPLSRPDTQLRSVQKINPIQSTNIKSAAEEGTPRAFSSPPPHARPLNNNVLISLRGIKSPRAFCAVFCRAPVETTVRYVYVEKRFSVNLIDTFPDNSALQL
ncbi:hypothetical protein EVAR_63020_1 [Eumeta japonica]|uniref:Uncharacterized protein n=1 Tax=Eumeta variegata TaxID=151549 RepID=A0A4C1YSA3_EUMVA|nr:hypothetical protein EVAR_63020_1 [Eumeta japonica]